MCVFFPFFSILRLCVNWCRLSHFCICLSNLEHGVYETLIWFFLTGYEEENPGCGKKIRILETQLDQSISEDYGDLELNGNLVKPIVPVPCLEIDGVLQPILNSDGKLLPPSEFAESEFLQQITTSISEEERKYNINVNLNTSSRIELETDTNTNILSIQDHELSKIHDSKLIVQEDQMSTSIDNSGKFVKNELETSTLSIEENLLSLRSLGHENEVPAQLLKTNTFGCNLFSSKYTEENGKFKQKISQHM